GANLVALCDPDQEMIDKARADALKSGGLIRLEGEPCLNDVLRHEATKDIPQTLPRNPNHGKEWLDACRGEGKTFSDFDVGGKLTEIGLAGAVGRRSAVGPQCVR
ncbi:MAG: hypothetical protein ABIP48_14135, partial [Planctomycetota bacterium]